MRHISLVHSVDDHDDRGIIRDQLLLCVTPDTARCACCNQPYATDGYTQVHASLAHPGNRVGVL